MHLPVNRLSVWGKSEKNSEEREGGFTQGFPKQRACEQARDALNMTEKFPTT